MPETIFSPSWSFSSSVFEAGHVCCPYIAQLPIPISTIHARDLYSVNETDALVGTWDGASHVMDPGVREPGAPQALGST
jgi:hypothetical protein